MSTWLAQDHKAGNSCYEYLYKGKIFLFPQSLCPDETSIVDKVISNILSEMKLNSWDKTEDIPEIYIKYIQRWLVNMPPM